MAAHHTGVPAATWSALDLLTFGSGPGCQPESRTPGVSVQIDLLGAAGIRGNPELMRIVDGSGVGPPGAHRPAAGGRRHDCRADVAADRHRVDADPGSAGSGCRCRVLLMSPASAEQVTVQIRTVLDRAWEFIALAYKGRAFIALGYPNWDAYVDARFGDLRIAVPREHRAQVVARWPGCACRFGRSPRSWASVSGRCIGNWSDQLAGRVIQRAMPANRRSRWAGTGRIPRHRTPSEPCRTCGEQHPAGTVSCPWDLYAQGIGPNPPARRGRDLRPP